MFADFADRSTRHGTTVVYDKTEMLLNLLKRSLLLEKFIALKKLDVHDDLVFVCDFILECTKKLVTVFWWH